MKHNKSYRKQTDDMIKFKASFTCNLEEPAAFVLCYGITLVALEYYFKKMSYDLKEHLSKQ